MIAHPESSSPTSTMTYSTHTARRWKPNYESSLSHAERRRRRSLGDLLAGEEEEVDGHHRRRRHSTNPIMGHTTSHNEQQQRRLDSMDSMPSQPVRARSPVHQRTHQRRYSMPTEDSSCCLSQQMEIEEEDGTKKEKEEEEEDKNHYDDDDDDANSATMDYAPGLPPKRLPSLKQHLPYLLTDDDDDIDYDDDDDDSSTSTSYYEELEEEDEVPTMLSVAGGGAAGHSFESSTSITLDFDELDSTSTFPSCSDSFTVDLAPPAIPIRTHTPDQNNKKYLPDTTCTNMRGRKKNPPTIPDSFLSPDLKKNAKTIQKQSNNIEDTCAATGTPPNLSSICAPPSTVDSVDSFAGGDSSAESFFVDLYSPVQAKPIIKAVVPLPNISKYGYGEAEPDVADRNNNDNNNNDQGNNKDDIDANTLRRPSHRSASLDLSALPSAMKKGGTTKQHPQQKNQTDSFSRRILSFDKNIKVHEVSPIAKDFKNDIWFQKNEKKIIKKNLYKAVQGVQCGWMDRCNHGGCNDDSSSNGAMDVRGIEGYLTDVAKRRDKTMDNLYDMVLDTQSIQRQSKCHDDLQLASFSKQVSEESRRLAIERALHDAMMVGTHTKTTTMMTKTTAATVYAPFGSARGSGRLQRRSSMF